MSRPVVQSRERRDDLREALELRQRHPTLGHCHLDHFWSHCDHEDRRAPDLVFATHDHQLGRAATALGFKVLGVT